MDILKHRVERSMPHTFRVCSCKQVQHCGISGYHKQAYSAAGILPLPFSTICVAAGALKMDIRRILICCSMRYIRTALYFTFFRIGLMAFA